MAYLILVQWSSTWFSSSNEPFHYWDIVKKFDHPNTLQSIDDMSDEVQTSEGKVSCMKRNICVLVCVCVVVVVVVCVCVVVVVVCVCSSSSSSVCV